MPIHVDRARPGTRATRLAAVLVLSTAVGLTTCAAPTGPPAWCEDLPPDMRPPACEVVLPDPTGTATSVESAYARTGPYATATLTAVTPAGVPYTIVHPAPLQAPATGYPVIAWGNGTDRTATTYTGTLGHLASWGFVLVAAGNPRTGYGTELWAATSHVLAETDDATSPFHHQLDRTKVGAAGHSQGATGALNATILSGGAITSTLTSELVDPRWFSAADEMPDLSRVHTPTFLISGTADVLSTTAAQQAYYDRLTGPAVKAALVDGDHFVIEDAANPQLGYLTAWFMYTLRGDATAREAFAGPAPEISGNVGWADQAVKNMT